MKNLLLSISALIFISAACMTNAQQEESSTAVGYEGWLKGKTDEKFNEVAHQLQGFSRTMWEVSYRYTELYFAGMDENWDYANYQLEHIDEAMEQGLIRRPSHEESAQTFVKVVIPAMQDAIDAKDSDAFINAFNIMTTNCNACHAMEEVAFITVKTPERRLSPVRP
jgi:hypothetical protein